MNKSAGKNSFLVIALVMVSGFLAACSGNTVKMYQGSSPGKDKVAYLNSTGTLKTIMSKTATVVIKKINSMETNMEKSAVHPTLELLPGKHKLEIKIIREVNEEVSQSYGSVFKEYSFDKTLSFVAEPGHTYQIYGYLDINETFPWFAWIVDKKAGQIVAGVKPGVKPGT